jgi:DNA-directed RNA polymerase III subunit RPC4
VQTTDDHDISGGHSAQTSATLGGSRPNITTPQHLLDDDADPSPNSSPATIPTETPATTPARANIPRSDPSGSNVPQPSSSSIRGGRGGARGGAATKPATTSRFKPKNVRRDASELEEIARKENDRLAAIAAENAREASAKMRGRGRPLRGRGDAMGRGMGRKTTATGTFGVAPEALSKSYRNPVLVIY